MFAVGKPGGYPAQGKQYTLMNTVGNAGLVTRQHAVNVEKSDICVKVFADGRKIVFKDLLHDGPGAVDGYRLDLVVDGLVHLKVHREDGAEMDVDHLELLVSTPLLNYSRIILPDTGRDFVFRDRSLYLRSAPSGVSAPKSGFPFLTFLDQTGNVALAFGSVSFFRESRCFCVEPRISSRKAMVGGADHTVMAMRLPSEGWQYGRTACIEETVFIGERFPSWYHALREYAAHCAAAYEVEYPKNIAAWDSSWCTWTAWGSERMTTERLLANARIARDLGMRTIIIDDGWFGPGLDEDEGQGILNIGDYRPDPSKFADLRAAIKEMQAMGLRVLLWYAPTCVAPDSEAYQRLNKHLMADNDEPIMAPNGFYSLCPGNVEARAYVREEVQRMLTDYEPDGFKVDLYNTLPATPCVNGHPHDSASMVEGVQAMMRDLWEAALDVKPDCLLELKQDYGNVITAQYGTMVRAGDTAYDIDTNLWRCFFAQAYAPVVHNDYLAVSTEEDPQTLAIMMIKMITAGVPTFSLDLEKQPAANLNTIRAWLQFYAQYREELMCPREPLTPLLDIWRLGSADTAIVSVVFNAAEIPLPDGHDIWLLNGTGRDCFYIRTDEAADYSVQAFDHNLKPGDSTGRRIGDGTRLPALPGSCLHLTRC